MRISLFILSLFFFFSLSSQKGFREKHYTYFDGLSSDYVNFTCSSSKGFLFISTQNGLLAFDGYRFIDIGQSKQKIFSQFLFNDTLYYQDNDALKKIGLNQLGNAPETIISKVPDDSDPNNDHFDYLFVDSKRRVWCRDFDNIKYSKDGKPFNFFEIFKSNEKNILPVSFIEVTENEIWIACSNGLWIWNNDKIRKHDNEILADKYYISSYKINDSLLLLATTNEVILWNVDKYTPDAIIANPREPIRSITEINGEIFMASQNAVYKLNLNTKKLEIFYTTEHIIHHLFFDVTTNLLWISTAKGLTKLVFPKKGIETFLYDENSTVTSIAESKDEIYATTDHGTIWKFQNRKWKKIEHSFPLNAQTVSVIENRIFVGMDNGLVEIINDTPERIPLTQFPSGKIVRNILLTPNKELWIVFDKARIHKYNFDTFEFLSDEFANNALFWDENLWNDALVDKHGTVWLVGWMPSGFGINRYDPIKNVFIDISDTSINPDRKVFVGDYYNRIYETKNNGLLVSAFGGWNRINNEGKVVEKIDKNTHDIKESYLTGISEHDNQNVFFATGEGLHIYRKDLDKVVRLTKADGLPTDYLTKGYTVLQNGLIALGIPSGLTLVNPAMALESELTARNEVSYLTVNGQTRFLEENHFELNKKENNLSIYFSELSYLDNFKVGHRYKINSEEAWTELGHQSELSFNNLNPGSYNITIETYDHIGNTQQQQLKLNYTAHPPFTKSALFYVLIGLLITSLVLFLNWYLLKKKQKEDEFLKRIKEAEMEALRAQMNPHFMFNTLNSINSYIIQNKTKDASKYLTSFSKLMRNILENSKHKFISLEKEVQTLNLYVLLESARLEHFFDYKVTIAEDVPTNHILIPPLVMQPFVENAIWHGIRNKHENGLISINILTTKDDTLLITIEDNGIGREKSAELKTNRTSHKSYGIDITEDRLKMVNPENKIEFIDLYDDQSNPMGTKVLITLKINEDD